MLLVVVLAANSQVATCYKLLLNAVVVLPAVKHEGSVPIALQALQMLRKCHVANCVL